jgi:hypothetical protein
VPELCPLGRCQRPRSLRLMSLSTCLIPCSEGFSRGLEPQSWVPVVTTTTTRKRTYHSVPSFNSEQFRGQALAPLHRIVQQPFYLSSPPKTRVPLDLGMQQQQHIGGGFLGRMYPPRWVQYLHELKSIYCRLLVHGSTGGRRHQEEDLAVDVVFNIKEMRLCCRVVELLWCCDVLRYVRIVRCLIRVSGTLAFWKAAKRWVT